MGIKLTERLKSLGHIASLVNAGSALSEVLNLIVTAVCQRSSWSSSAIMAVDESIGYSVLVARFDPLFAGRKDSVDRWPLETSPVKSVLETRQSLVIADAQKLPSAAGYRREAVERDYRTVVLLPFSATDAQDRKMVLSVHAHEVRKVDEEEIAFLETVALLGSLAVEKAHRLWLEAQQNDWLRQALDIHQLAMEQVLTTDDTEAFVDLCRRYLARPLLLVDLTTNKLVATSTTPRDPAALPVGSHQQIFRQLAQLVRDTELGQFEKIRSIPLPNAEAGKEADVIIEPCIAGGQVLGGIILLTGGQALEPREALTAQQLRAAFAMLLLRRQIRFDVQAETHGEFFSRLFSGNWRDAAETLARAHHLDLPLDEPARLAALALPGSTMPGAQGRPQTNAGDIEQALARIARQRLPGATAFAERDGSGGATYVVFLPERRGGAKAVRQVLQQMIDEIAWLAQAKATACLGVPCHRLEDYRDARRECERLLKLAARAGRHGIVESGDFGPLARLIAMTDADALRGFVSETIGAIDDYDRAHEGNLLGTLDRYLANSGRYQATADALGIHVTTLRYRLQRLSDLFNLDLEDPDTRAALDLALRVRGSLAPN